MNLSLLRTAQKIKRLEDLAKKNPLAYFRPSPPQLEVLKATEPIVLFRAANQLGKTICGAAEILHYALGNHPYKSTPKPPLKLWIIVHSWEQSKVVQSKVQELIPPNSLSSDCPEYIAGRGFRGKTPMIKFANGSLINFKTTNQGNLGVASATLDFVWIDEPCPQSIYGEIAARLLRKRGRLLMTMTPIGGGDLSWLRRLTETKPPKVRDIHAALTVQNCTPLGLKFPLLTQSDIDRIAQTYLPIDKEARLLGSWDIGFPMDGRIFMNFGEEHVSDEPCPADGDFVFSIGIDHGHTIDSQCALLIAIDRAPKNPVVYVLDEYFAAGGTNEKHTANRHARAIIAMIRRNGLEPLQINRWTGDRPHSGGKHGGRMSNALLRAALEHVLDYPNNALPFRIRTAYKPRWSVYYGCQLIHECMTQGRFQVNSKCKRLIRSFSHWTLKKSGGMDKNSEWKHAIDALRYAVTWALDAKYHSPKVSKIPLRRK